MNGVHIHRYNLQDQSVGKIFLTVHANLKIAYAIGFFVKAGKQITLAVTHQSIDLSRSLIAL